MDPSGPATAAQGGGQYDLMLGGQGRLRSRKPGVFPRQIESQNTRHSSVSASISNHSTGELGDSGHQSSTRPLCAEPAGSKRADVTETSHWHSAPLIFALLPALAGLVSHQSSAIATDVTLLVFAAVFLNWSIRMPWEWYRSAQSVQEGCPNAAHHAVPGEASDPDTNHPGSEASAIEQRQQQQLEEEEEQDKARSAASKELRRHELMALLACFVLPLGGAWLLHAIRSQLSRPSEGLVSNYNLTIFLLASEMRPTAHLLKIIQARTVHLQRQVHAVPLPESVDGRMDRLAERLDALEAQLVEGNSQSRKASDAKSAEEGVAMIASEVRRGFQPEVDALNRAVRRYEKRATVQAMHTESRLLELESRINDAISLAAAAAEGVQLQRRPSYAASIVRLMRLSLSLPLRIVVTLVGLPAKVSTTAVALGKALVIIGFHKEDEYAARSNGRVRDRPSRRTSKRAS